MKQHLIALPILLSLSLASTASTLSTPNESSASFTKAKRILTDNIYNSVLPNKTIYCAASFNGKRITDLNGFYSNKYKSRSKRIEYEHVVPASAFGINFKEWKLGDTRCVNRKGKKYKGRRCVGKVNSAYKKMQADMYNLYPAIGAANALRSNYPYSLVEGEPLGKCNLEIKDKEANPPNRAKGIVSRVSLYMNEAYTKYDLEIWQHILFIYWNNTFPVTDTECRRNKLIKSIQGNTNRFVEEPCVNRNKAKTSANMN